MKKEQLKDFRTVRKMSVFKMAAILNVTPDIISKIENGNIGITPKFEKRFFELFENSFTVLEKEIFKEKYPYNNIKLLDDSSGIKERESISTMIFKFRKDCNFTQSYFAKQLGISTTTFSNAELGQTELPISAIQKFDSLYGDMVLKRDNYTNVTNSYITNFVVNNELTDMLDKIIQLELSKEQLNILFSSTLRQAKQIKKQIKPTS